MVAGIDCLIEINFIGSLVNYFCGKWVKR